MARFLRRSSAFTKAPRAAFTLIELLVVIAIIAILAAILFPVFAQAREKARAASCLSNTKQIGLAFVQYASDYDGLLMDGEWAAGISGNNVGGWPITTTKIVDEKNGWPAYIMPYVKNRQVFDCPTSIDRIATQNINDIDGNYVWNEEASDDGGDMLDNLGAGLPAETILIMDGGDAAIQNKSNLQAMMLDNLDSNKTDSEQPTRHQEQAVVAFGDGHAKTLKKGDLLKGWRRFEVPWGINWTTEAAPNPATVFAAR
jgi:prepilin-type N-terminal cleavage/methylation domain-containing protein/prepilin-type processing-associated H-X9-DG protein